MEISLTLNYQENGVNPIDIEGANKMLLGFGYEIKELRAKGAEGLEKPARKRRTKTPKEEPKEELKEELKEEPKEEITLDTLKDVARTALKDHSRDTVKAIIQKYGEKIVDVDVKDYDTLVAELKAL